MWELLRTNDNFTEFLIPNISEVRPLRNVYMMSYEHFFMKGPIKLIYKIFAYETSWHLSKIHGENDFAERS